MPDSQHQVRRPVLRLKGFEPPAVPTPTSPSPASAPGSEQRADQANSTLAILIAQFPNCFYPADARARPLAIGIDKAIIAALPDLDPADISAVLASYCSELRYYRAIVRCRCRIDLSGNPAGYISPSARKHSAAALAKAVQS